MCIAWLLICGPGGCTLSHSWGRHPDGPTEVVGWVTRATSLHEGGGICWQGESERATERPTNIRSAWSAPIALKPVAARPQIETMSAPGPKRPYPCVCQAKMANSSAAWRAGHHGSGMCCVCWSHSHAFDTLYGPPLKCSHCRSIFLPAPSGRILPTRPIRSDTSRGVVCTPTFPNPPVDPLPRLLRPHSLHASSASDS